ncbi:MAG: CapA family protein [Oscillospiraceae bacterium]|nr:CapA family protein [Oscillospiraceae bacterium]
MGNSGEKLRSAYWDNIKGLLIFLVVFAHCLYGLRDTPVTGSIVDAIYMFHMPAFVFVSGYFGKSENSRSLKSVSGLIFIYFIFNSLMGLAYGFNSLLEPVYSCWYILALAVWRVTAPYLAKFRDIQLILFAVSLFAGFYDSIDNTFAIARIISFYPFYMAGYLLTEEKSQSLICKNKAKRLLWGLAALIGAAAAGFGAYSFFDYSDSALLMYSYELPMDAFGRIGLFVTAFLAIYALRAVSPDKKLPFFTMTGRNSLGIFLLHRPITLLFGDIFGEKEWVIAAAFLCSVIICLAFGNDLVTGLLNAYIKAGAELLTGTSEKKKGRADILARVTAAAVALCFVGSIVINEYDGFSFDTDIAEEASAAESEDVFYPVMDDEEKAEFDSAFRITFAGDLILLEDQVKRGYNGSGYDFSDVFEYAAPHISASDLAIGVFEGPMAGEEAGYSTSNFDDSKELALNYPDEFAENVKNAGFDLVTTANNHLLDKGDAGAFRTLDILDKTGLEHTGSYRSYEEKESSRVKIVEKDGIKFAVLAYTYGSNGYAPEALADSFVTSIICGTEGELFEKLKSGVQSDFEAAKAYSPDLIIVLPHIGTQFSNGIDEEQKVWFEIFKECGADIILGDHAHAAEPALIEEYGGKKVFTAYCPGNFANIYREKQGDASALIDVYIDRETKELIGGGVVPLYTQSPIDGNYRALPVYEIQYNEVLRKQLSTDDYERAENAHNAVMNAVLGVCPDVSGITESYLFNENGFVRTKTTGLEITEEMENGALLPKLRAAETVCFVGDSITEGTKNGGCPWYEPIEEHISAEVMNFSKGGAAVSYLIENAGAIPKAELYVIAIGTNDVRYRDETQCAMTAESYADSISRLRQLIAEKAPEAEFVFIAPWYSIDGDPFCPLSFEDKTTLNNEYSAALEALCGSSGDTFIDPNGFIAERIGQKPCGYYLIDHIHPNSARGVRLYSEAVLNV